MTVELVVLDVNETLSDLSPLRKRFTDSGAPAHLRDVVRGHAARCWPCTPGT